MNGIQEAPMCEDVQNANHIIGIKKERDKTKICTKCGVEKDIDEFRLRKNRKSGRDSWCLSCRTQRRKDDKRYFQKWRQKNIEKVRRYQQKWRQKNREKTRRYSQKYRENHPKTAREKEKISIRNKEYRIANRSRLLAYDKMRYENNRERILAVKNAYNKKNKKKINARRIQKRKENSQLRLHHSFSESVRRSIKGKKQGLVWESLVGYTLNKLRKHLEKRFTDGMTWDNYGKWHVDHKIPVSVFNFTKPEHRDFQRCWALKNLQPMWAKDNIKKHAKLIKHFQPSLPL